MSNLGVAQKCDGLVAFRVDHTTIPSGTRLRRYYLHHYTQFMVRMQPLIEEGAVSLAEHLKAPEWQQLDLRNGPVGLESEEMKMMVVLEAIFEHTRQKLAPHLPSRLACVFVWPTLEFAKNFRKQFIPEGIIHRCCIMQGEAVELDGSLLPPGINLSDLSPEIFSAEFQAALLRAEKYWLAQESPKLSELLVVGSVEVMKVEPVR